MKYTTVALLGLVFQATAFPFVARDVAAANKRDNAVFRRQAGVPSTAAARALSASRTNCGVFPCVGFDAQQQFVSTSGQNAYASPAADEIRGPCPGLNAAANHAYFSRSGVLTIADTISGLSAAYGLGADASAALAAYAIITGGDPVLGTWSIGGPPPGNGLTKGLLGGSQGISYSHNVYEGDSSIGRNDAYINNGDAHSLNPARFATAFAVGRDDDRYTLDKFAAHFLENAKLSESQNPYYFTGPFSTTVVSPAAYNFVINFMSNHSAESPSGYLDGNQFKQFFAITGDYPDFTWLPGQERIPEDWYRRPLTSSYGVRDIGADLGVNWAAYPDSFRLGGNTNGVNTYSGVDLADLTGGAFHFSDLLDSSGANGACFFAQLIQSVIPDTASLPLAQLSAITDLINDHIKPITGGLDCPAIDKYDQTLFNKFPGYKYSPTGPATNY